MTGLPAAFDADLRRLLRDETAPESLFDARRQADRAADVIGRLLESEGYYLAEVTPWAEGVETFARGVRVVHGPQFTYGETRIEFTGSAPDDLTVAAMHAKLDPLAIGAPAQAQPVIDIGDALVRQLRAAGYADAKGMPVDALADGRAHTVDLAYQLTPGPRVAFGDVSLSGLGRTREDFIQALKPWREGERYSPAKLDDFRTRLAETGLFDSATARLDDPGDQPAPTNANGLRPRDVHVELRERKRRTVTLGASASTSEGAGVEAGWELRNITGRADSVKLAAQAATLESRLSATYRRPNIARYGRNLTLGVEVEDLTTDAFDQTGANISATIEERITPRLRGSLGLEAGYATIDDTRTTNTGRRDIAILSGTGTLEYTGVRDILDPHNGVRARVTAEPGLTWGDTNIGFTRLSGEASVYGDLGSNRLVGALRGKIGGILGPQGAPPDRLFFAGGGGSVRGFEYQTLSPRDIDGNLLGGRSLIEASAELRWRASQTLGYVAFLDAGAAGETIDPPIDAMRAGAGVGVRYYAGFGPLRADIAIPLSKRDGEADFQIYISIGQAF